ncbi:mucin-5AC isoform X8 [Teleopsis dalmanni]|uniref:mucin-5AC isoform X8 n=1 Tax=Teleopsis dalmanni TaxID=139649 RepID=UPI0018CEB12E|nr:mucin-5AC isoform X8 [Teleopsis dalmanni]
MSQPNFGKDPLTPSHGDSLVDQSFESLKSKEIRDSMSPTHDMNFHSLTLKHPNTTGWDVQTSSEVSPDGRAYRSETLATTDGVEKINGGTAEFKGRNEQRSSASHQGDDKNFVKKASESSNTHLQEKVVIGDENSGRTEMKMSSTSTSSSSQVISSSTVEYDDEHMPSGNRYLTDNTSRHQLQNEHNRMQRLQEEEYRQREQRQRQQQQQQQQQQQHEFEQRQRLENQTTSTQQRQQQYSQEYNTNREETSTSRNVETQNRYEENKRYVDMDKASPEYQRQVQYLMSQPGEIISNTVEYPKPNVKMITTVKRLPDGTIVKNKRYETEELRPTNEHTHQRSTTTTNQSSTQRKNERHVEEQENTRNRQQVIRETDDYVTQKSSPNRRPNADVVDNIETTHHRDHDRSSNKQQLVESYPQDQYTDDVTNITKSFSTVKKSSRRFSTETTSESIEEIDDHSPRNKPIRSGRPTEDFSTHGFPSVKPNKPTQEYPTDRPHSATPSNDFSTQGFPSVKPNKMTQEYPTQRPHPVNELDMYVVQDSRRNTESSPRNLTKNTDDDVVVVSSESTRNFKHKTNSERTIETEVVTSGSDRTKQIESTTTNKSEDYSHGFPSVKGSSPLREISPRQGTPTRQTQPNDDFSTHGFPSVRSPTKGAPDYTTHGFPSSRDVIKSNKNIIVTPSSRGEEVITISSERTKNAKHNTTSERIIEMEVATDDDYTSSRPGNQNKNKPEDFSTHGFPSVKDKTPTREFSPRHDEYIPKSPTKTPDYSTHGFPSAKDSNKPRSVAPRHSPTTTTSTVKKPSAESAQKLIQKEKEVDAAHRAFAASLRSSSPIDNNRRDSYSDHHRQTPRSSVSSARTTPRRELREGSHDSAAPSEHSRISSTTVTRQSPTKTTGKTVVTKHTVVKTKNTNGSNETIDLTPQRSTKSPSPSKTTITTTTKTTTTKKLPAEVPKPDNQFTKPAENLFPINEPLTITKSNFTANDASFERNEAVEAPCIKKKFYLVGPSDKVSNKSIDEPSSPASQSPITKGKTKMTTTESIAARRNIFEKGVPTKTNKTNTPVQTGRRPSYMDHTMSSLEHRKDSLELNKTNYARKSSTEDDSLYDRRPNTAVKFRVPEKSVEGPISNIDDVNIEEIFDLEVLEQMLEITTSYEIRRRIRAQIRLVKKNMLNTQYIERANADTQKSTVFTTSEKTAKTMSTYETKDRSMINTKTTRKPIERSFSPDDRSNESVQESEDFECHRKPREHSPTSKTISSSLKEIRRVTDTSRSHPQDTVLTEEIVTVKIDKSKNRSTDQNFETRTDKQRIGSESPTCTYKSQDQVTVHVERIPKSSRDHSPEAKTISSSLKEVRRSTERNQHSEAIPSKGTMPTKHRDESISPSRSKPREPSPEWKNMSNTAKQGSRITEISTKETITTEKTIKNRKQSDSSISPTRSKSRDHSPEAKTTKSSLKERKQREGSISPTSSKSPDHSPEAKTISSMLKEVRRVSGEQESYSTQRKTQMEVVDTVEKVRTPILEKKRLPISSPERISKPLSRQESATPKGQSVARTQSPDKLKKQEYGLSSQKEETTRKRTDNASKVQPKPRVPQTSDNRTGKQQERENYTVTRTTVRTTYSPERKQSQTKVDEKTPIWADRKNILKNQGSNIVKKTPSPSTTRSNVTRTIKSSTQQQSRTFNEEDSITSSYGIGPTDENGLPLFGIKALRKKKQPEQPCETKEEVTGYIVEEKYFSDNKTKPTVQRKEYIYSTNADELEQIKKKVDSQKTSKDTEVTRTFEQIETGNELDGMKALTMSMPTTEEFSTSSTKHVRRGSVKEMSEKFIRKESSQSITEKSSSYPKAGLILRSTPRLSSGDATDAFESTTDIITKKFSSNDSKQDFDTEDHEFDMEQSKTVQTESESECESVKILRVTNQKSTRSSTSTRSFLNTSGDSKVVTGVDDVLERMRNADNVVEEGDTAEDQEARALLNKFLGASVIMRGVESALPTKQTRTTVTTYADGDGDGGGDKRKREIKTTRVTKTIKSGSSSSPVTYKTCAIEEIWDEELLKELLEQATNYEERRKIRARLRELMAEREENKNLKASEKATPAANTEDDESSASEYEEIIEEVTDYSESEDETELKKNTSIKKENDEEITKATIVKEDSEKAVLKKSSSTKSNDSLKTDISTTSFVSVEEIEEVVDKNIEKSKENVKNIVIEKVTSAVENLTTKTADSEDIAICADTQKTEQEQQQHATSTTERSETKEKDGSIVTTTTKVTTRTVSGTGPKPVSPFAKFRQLDKQNSQQSPRSPSTPTTPGGTASPSGSAPIFRFTDPALNARAATVKDQLLQWCQMKTKEYENVQITNFSTSWSDGLAFCALIHHFLPDAFDYSKLTPQTRRHNFELAFTVADEKAGIAPLLDVEDMVVMKRPDWKCVFVYVQSIYRRFRNCQ